jgi:hypothetical protein
MFEDRGEFDALWLVDEFMAAFLLHLSLLFVLGSLLALAVVI